MNYEPVPLRGVSVGDHYTILRKQTMQLKPISTQRFCIYDGNELVLDVEFGEKIWPMSNSAKISIASGILEALERELKDAQKLVQESLYANISS